MNRRLLILNLGTCLLVSFIAARQATGQTTYTLKATPKTVAWGYYDAKATTLSVTKWNQNAALLTAVPL